MNLTLSRLALAGAFYALIPVSIANSGDPIPGVDVSLEQIPGGRYATAGQCRSRGGSVVRRSGKTYCAKRVRRAVRKGTGTFRVRKSKKRRRRQSF